MTFDELGKLLYGADYVVETTEQKTSLLWLWFSTLINSELVRVGMDANAFITVQLWDYDNQLTANRKKNLKDISDWHTAQWAIYSTIKAQVLLGQSVIIPQTIAACPATFAALLANTLK